MIEALRQRTDQEMKESVGHLKPEEAAVMALLQNQADAAIGKWFSPPAWR